MILGIDPGLENTGWGIITNSEFEIQNLKSKDVDSNSDFQLVEAGVILTDNKDVMAERLNGIYEGVEYILKRYEIKEMAVESLFFAKNAKSAIKVAQAIGVIEVCARRNKVAVKEYTPLQVKMALVGYGRAEKDQVEAMVRATLGIDDNINPSHASDAVAVALTHAFTMKI